MTEPTTLTFRDKEYAFVVVPSHLINFFLIEDVYHEGLVFEDLEKFRALLGYAPDLIGRVPIVDRRGPTGSADITMRDELCILRENGNETFSVDWDPTTFYGITLPSRYNIDHAYHRLRKLHALIE